MEKFNEMAVIDLREKINESFRKFMVESAKPTVKAAVQRSRKITSELDKMLKEYRKISIK